jgi:hypothetical protein
MKGFCLESPPMEIEARQMQAVAESNAEWVAIIPYGFMHQSAFDLQYNSEHQWWGEREDGVVELIKMAHAAGLRTMVKPQIWIPRLWIGDYLPEDEEAWENSMRDFTLSYAQLADSLDVEVFCFGTEMKSLTSTNSEFFFDLIKEIRTVYSGQLTYAANWDEYAQVDFWNELDFIGVNAYFPLSEAEHPSVAELEAAWNSFSEKIAEFSEKQGKPILFTEFGYRSVKSTAAKPWEHHSEDYLAEGQVAAFEALFNTVWNEPWMAGGFIWKWRFFKDIGGHGDPSFTPQGKPALDVIKKHYSK